MDPLYYLKILLLLSHVHALTHTNWSQLSYAWTDALLPQRDLASSVPVNQLTRVGVSLNRVVFDKLGYSRPALALLLSFLSQSIGVYSLDVYWNEYTNKWQLCPAPIPLNVTWDSLNVANLTWGGLSYLCQVDMLPAEVFTTISSYISQTNTERQANVLQVALMPKTIAKINVSNSSVPQGADFNTSMNAAGNSSLGDFASSCLLYMFMPTMLNTTTNANTNNYTALYGSRYPSQLTFLSKLSQRLMVFVLNTPQMPTRNGFKFDEFESDIFFIEESNPQFTPLVALLANLTLARTLERAYRQPYDSTFFWDMAHTTEFRMVFDSDAVPFTNKSLLFYAKSGFTPVVNSSAFYFGDLPGVAPDAAAANSINYIVPNSFWSWAPGQPVIKYTNTTDVTRKENSDNDNPQWAIFSDAQLSYLCVSVETAGWSVDNCYNRYRYACKNDTDPFSWVISDRIKTYFASVSEDGCPDGTSFNPPRLALEQYSLLALLQSTNVLYPVWIDLNDVYLSGCFVSGGPYAECPYQKVLTTTSLIKRIAPSLVVSLFLIVLILSEHVFTRTPIQTNRTRHWKKTLAQYYKENDFEGVPS